MFLETFRKYAGTVMETIYKNVQVIQKWTQVSEPFYQFSKHFVMVVSNTDQKRIPMNDNIAWCKYSRVSKDLLKSESFFLLNAPKYFSILSTRKLCVFSEMCSFQEKSVKLKSFLCEENCSQNF